MAVVTINLSAGCGYFAFLTFILLAAMGGTKQTSTGIICSQVKEGGHFYTVSLGLGITGRKKKKSWKKKKKEKELHGYAQLLVTRQMTPDGK